MTDSFRTRQLARSRYGIVYDIDGPRVRLGVVWFVAALATLYVGLLPFAVLLAGVAGLAAAQTARALQVRWRNPDKAVAAAFAAGTTLAAALGTALAGLAIIAAAVLSVVLAGRRAGVRTDPLVDAGAVVRSALAVGCATSALVMLYRFDIGAAASLIVLVSAYEVGDFLIGTGARNHFEGPGAGVLAVAAASALLAALQPPPFAGAAVWLYGAVAALLAPAGQVLASAVLPRAGLPAPALRRLDSYLLAAPAWLLLLWAGVGT